MDEEKGKSFLEKNNFFFRLKQYCSTCTEQTKSGKYIGLDFGHLVELSTIDMFLRKLLLKMTIDLEHYLKVKLVNTCQNNPADDGYEVVQKFLETDSLNLQTGKQKQIGESKNLQIPFENHSVKKIMERIDKILERYDTCADLGMWNCAMYCISDEWTAQMAAWRQTSK